VKQNFWYGKQNPSNTLKPKQELPGAGIWIKAVTVCATAVAAAPGLEPGVPVDWVLQARIARISTMLFPFVINTAGSAASFIPSINLIPFYFGGCFNMPAQCTAGIVDNILLTIPFGFGINFLARVRPRIIFWLALGVGLGCEISPLCISMLFRSGFRAIDINDVILNAAGVWMEYALFRAFAWSYIRTTVYFGFRPKWLAADIYDIAIQTHAADKSKQVIKS